MCTEKNYGGASSIPKGKMIVAKVNNKSIIESKEKIKNDSETSNLTSKEIENYRKAGKIAAEVSNFARKIIRKGSLLIDIAEEIEAKIIELGGKPAFPCNLSINDIAAHYTPSFDDSKKAEGLLKIDFGVSCSGFIADMAFSLDLENSEENKKLILASEKAVENAVQIASKTKKLNEIGKEIYKTITSLGFSPIRNLSGHELGEYTIHAGITIPNYDNGNEKLLEKGAYAIEPFATTGSGLVYEGKPSGIYRLEKIAGIRDMLARQILDFVQKEYSTLPFCERWMIKKFGSRAKLSLHFLEQQGIIHQYPQLVEQNHEKVSQAEHTILVADKIEVTTKFD